MSTPRNRATNGELVAAKRPAVAKAMAGKLQKTQKKQKFHRRSQRRSRNRNEISREGTKAKTEFHNKVTKAAKIRDINSLCGLAVKFLLFCDFCAFSRLLVFLC